LTSLTVPVNDSVCCPLPVPPVNNSPLVLAKVKVPSDELNVTANSVLLPPGSLIWTIHQAAMRSLLGK
jgi:hypothetical protein